MEDIICNGCSLLCDDGMVRFEGALAKSYGFCRLGHAYLVSALNGPDCGGVIREGGLASESSIETALERVSALLATARRQLILVGPRSSNETITEALSLAATLRGVFDSSATLGPTQVMSHDIYRTEPKANLEDVRNRCEFILYWGTDPAQSSHRHSSRFSVFPRGEKIPQGVESRVVGVVDVRETETMKIANHRIVIPIGSDSEFAGAITSELTGKKVVKDSILGVPASSLVGLVRALQKSDCIVVFFGTGITNSGKSDEGLSAIAGLTQTLRDMGKEAFAMPIWQGANDMGAVLRVAELTGTPGPVDFADGEPASRSPNTVLQGLVEAAFDSALVIGGDPLASLPGPAARRLADTQTVYIGPQGGLTDKRALVSIHVRDDIVVGSGSLCRIDGTEMRLRTWDPDRSRLPNTAESVARLHQLVKKKHRE